MKGFKKYTTVSALVAALVIGFPAQALAVTTVELGTADSFAVLAGTEVTNVPTSAITGDVGLSPGAGSSYDAGVTQAQVDGTIYAVDGTGPAGSVEDPALLTQAKADLVTAYDDAAGRTPTDTFVAGDNQLGGQTLTSGVYAFGHATTANIVGTLTLSGGANSVFIFQASSDLVTASSSVVDLIGGVKACNVFWQVDSSATLGTDSVFVGNIMALTAITVNTGATIEGSALARNAAVTLDQNVITDSACAAVVPPDSGSGSGSDSSALGSDTGSLAVGDIVPGLPNAGAGPRE